MFSVLFSVFVSAVSGLRSGQTSCLYPAGDQNTQLVAGLDSVPEICFADVLMSPRQSAVEN